jgi:hypothetical protein
MADDQIDEEITADREAIRICLMRGKRRKAIKPENEKPSSVQPPGRD